MIAYAVLPVLCLSSGCDDIISEDISDDKVTVIAPIDNSVLFDSEVNFSWEYLDGATSYHLQVVYPDFDQAQKLVLDTVVSGNNFTKTLEIGGYEWRLNARNDQYESLYFYKKFAVVSKSE